MDASALTYHEGPFGSKRLRSAMASFLNEAFKPATPISADLISFVSGVTAINEALALCLTEEHEGLLLGMPIYGSFSFDFTTTSKYTMLMILIIAFYADRIQLQAGIRTL
jgi:aspartate/methionine/tyrosine aminotransferase